MTPARRAEVALLIVDVLPKSVRKPVQVAAELAILYELGRNFERAAVGFCRRRETLPRRMQTMRRGICVGVRSRWLPACLTRGELL